MAFLSWPVPGCCEVLLANEDTQMEAVSSVAIVSSARSRSLLVVVEIRLETLESR